MIYAFALLAWFSAGLAWSAWRGMAGEGLPFMAFATLAGFCGLAALELAGY
jgi:hypothetical protein